MNLCSRICSSTGITVFLYIRTADESSRLPAGSGSLLPSRQTLLQSLKQLLFQQRHVCSQDQTIRDV